MQEAAVQDILQPHDRAFKIAMTDLRVARDCIQNHLPGYAKGKIDLDTLTLQNGSFIDRKFQHISTDILYRATSIDSKKNPCYIYLLFEHQRNPEWQMPFRLLTSSPP